MSNFELVSFSCIEELNSATHNLSNGYILSDNLLDRTNCPVEETQANPVRIRKKPVHPYVVPLGTAGDIRVFDCCRGDGPCY